MPNCWLYDKIRKILRPAISKEFFVVFLYIQAYTEIVPKFQIAVKDLHVAFPI
jgi:hypothetical protein